MKLNCKYSQGLAGKCKTRALILNNSAAVPNNSAFSSLRTGHS